MAYYSGHFSTVEINSSFYQIPKPDVLTAWYQDTPPDFLFTMKGSRYVTHLKKLKDVDKSIREFYEGIELLKEKVACVLWQLPAQLHFHRDKLVAFCQNLSTQYQNVIEFRHPSWFNEEALDILKDHGVSYCIISAPDDLPESIHVTTNVAYVRFHGKSAWYDYHYSDEELTTWYHKLKSLHTQRLFAYFNNDVDAHSVKNARQLKSLFDGATG